MRLISYSDRQLIIHSLRHIEDVFTMLEREDITLNDAKEVVMHEKSKIYNHLHFDIYAGVYGKGGVLC